MSFDRKTFLGASIRNIQSSIGWNGQPSQLTVGLVEDLTNGDLFSPPEIGQPCYFEIGSMKFYGLLEKYTYDKSTSGNLYTATIVDPRKLLEKTKLILDGYSGSVYGVRNLLNIYGILEGNFGFGGSQINSSGIPWQLIRDGILSLVNGPLGIYGGPIIYKGYSYTLNLAELPPDLPPYFRMSGYPSILEFIQTVCDYANHDFFIELVGLQIKLRTVSRYTQPPLGTLTTLINSYSGTNLIRSSAGVESRDEVTASFLIGGEATDLNRSDTIESCYGLDINNNPIIGTSGRIDFRRADGVVTHTEDTYFFNLDSSVVGSILGLAVYPCSDFELRIIAHGGNAAYGNWISFITKYRPDIASRLNFPSLTTLIPPPLALPMPLDFFRLGLENVLNAIRTARHASAVRSVKTFFEWLRGIAAVHLGKTYIVKLPFLLYKVESETNRLITSYEVANEAFLDVTTNTLDGLDSVRRELLAGNDGRFPAIGVFFNTSTLDLTKVSDVDSVVDSTGNYFTKVNVNPKIYFVPEPAVIVNLSQGAFQEIDENYDPLSRILNASTLAILPGGAGGGAAIGAGGLGAAALRFAASAITSFKVHPKPVKLDACHIPLKSNVITYGPWYAVGVNGNVRYEQDSSLTPWNYGGLSFMNQAAQAKVSASISNVTQIESGFIELEGIPTYSLGDVLDADGPNITDISVTYDVQSGGNTTYRFSTYVPRFGQIGKYLSDRIRSIGIISQTYSRNARESILERSIKTNRLRDTERSGRAYLASLPPGIRRETPHNMLIGFAEKGLGDDGIVRHGISTVEVGESMFMLAASGDEYPASVATTINSILSPISIYGSGRYMSRMEAATGVWSTLLNGELYNPYKANPSGWSTDIFTFGDSYPESGINTFVNPNEASGEVTRRVFALKGPLLLTSFGQDLNGNYVPGSSVFKQNYLQRPDLWKTGPIDHLWDNNRKVWTSHDVVKGVAATDIGPSGGTLNVNGWNLTVYSSTTISSGQTAFAFYTLNENRWNAPVTSNFGSAVLTTGNPYTVFHTNPTGSQVWSNAPNILGLILGGSGVGNGYLDLNNSTFVTGTGDSVFTKRTRLSAGNRVSELNVIFPTGNPAVGDSVSVGAWDGSSATLKFYTPDIVSTGGFYTVLHTDGIGARVWSDSPNIKSLQLGGSGSNFTGYLELGRTGSDTTTRIYEGNRTSNLRIVLPTGIPNNNDLLRVKTWDGLTANLDFIQPSSTANIFLTGAPTGIIFESEFSTQVVGSSIQVGANWGTPIDISTANASGGTELFAKSDHVHKHPRFLSGDLHPEYNLPTGISWSMLWQDDTNTKRFSTTPIIEGIYLGGTGITNTSFCALGVPGSLKYTFLRGQQQFHPSGLNIFLPSGVPTGTGQLMMVSRFDNGAANVWLEWAGLTNIPPTGIDKTFNYVSNVSCSGSTLIVTSGTMVFINGQLRNLY